MNRFSPRSPHQTGTTLLLGLLLLALLSLLVTNAVSGNRWQHRVASHEIAEARAETAARSALAWAEHWLMSLPGDRRPPRCARDCIGSPILHPDAMPADPHRLDERWWLDHAHALGADPLRNRQVPVAGDPRTPAGRWLVAEAYFAPAGALGVGAPDVSFYRVVARAARAPTGTPVVVETMVARPWGNVTWSDPLPATATAFCRSETAPRPCGRLSWRRRL